LALECQLFLDVDCSNITYSSTVHPQVAAAATQKWNKQHGWTDEEDKKRKILALPRFAEYMRKVREGRAGGPNQELVDKIYEDWMAGKGASPCSIFNRNFTVDCRVATIEAEIAAPNKWNGTTTRTQPLKKAWMKVSLGSLFHLLKVQEPVSLLPM